MNQTTTIRAAAWLLAAGALLPAEKLTLEQSRLPGPGEQRRDPQQPHGDRGRPRGETCRLHEVLPPRSAPHGASFRADKPLFEFTIEGGNLPVYDGNPAHLPFATQFAYFPSSSIGMFGKGTSGCSAPSSRSLPAGRILNGNKLASSASRPATRSGWRAARRPAPPRSDTGGWSPWTRS